MEAANLMQSARKSSLRNKCRLCGGPFGKDALSVDCKRCMFKYHRKCVGIDAPASMDLSFQCEGCAALANSEVDEQEFMADLGNRTFCSRSSSYSDQSTMKNASNRKFEYQNVSKEPRTSLLDQMLEDLDLKNKPLTPEKTFHEIPKTNQVFENPFDGEDEKLLTPEKASSKRFSEKIQENLFENPLDKKKERENERYSGTKPKEFLDKKTETVPNAAWNDFLKFDQREIGPKAEPQKIKKSYSWKQDELPDIKARSPRTQANPVQPEVKNDGISEALHALTRVMMRQNIEPLPKFDGSFETWPIFIAQYNASKVYFDAEGNLMRLRNSLTDRALKLVKNHLAFSRNPDVVIDKLKENFGRQDGTIRDVVNKIRQIATPEVHDSSSLLRFKEELEDGFAVLASLNAHGYLQSPTIVDDVLSRCPREMRQNWGNYAYQQRNLRPGQAVLADFVEWTQGYTKWIMWDVDLRSTRKNQTTRSASSRESESRSKPVFVHEELENVENDTGPTGTGNKFTSKCPLCSQENHNLAHCKKFCEMTVSKRWELAKKKYLCFICLDRMHKHECPMKRKCEYSDCDKFHHKLLHKDAEKRTERKIETSTEKNFEKDSENGKDKDSENEEKLHATIKNSEEEIYFKIIPVKLYGRSATGSEIVLECNAFLDDGSALTLMSKETARALNLVGPTKELRLGWTDGSSRKIKDSQDVSLCISDLYGTSKYVMNQVRTVPDLNLPAPKINVEEMVRTHDHLKNLDIPQPLKQKPCILIGEKHAHLMATLDIREGLSRSPMAIRTRIGWLVHGRNSLKEEPGNLLSAFTCELKTGRKQEPLMSHFFSQDESKLAVTKIEKEEERQTNDQVELMQTELLEMSTSNCRLSDQLEIAGNQIELQRKEIAELKKQIKTLEHFNRAREKAIVGPELVKDTQITLTSDFSLKMLQEKAMNDRKNDVKPNSRLVPESVCLQKSFEEPPIIQQVSEATKNPKLASIGLHSPVEKTNLHGYRDCPGLSAGTKIFQAFDANEQYVRAAEIKGQAPLESIVVAEHNLLTLEEEEKVPEGRFQKTRWKSQANLKSAVPLMIAESKEFGKVRNGRLPNKKINHFKMKVDDTVYSRLAGIELRMPGYINKKESSKRGWRMYDQLENDLGERPIAEDGNGDIFKRSSCESSSWTSRARKFGESQEIHGGKC